MKGLVAVKGRIETGDLRHARKGRKGRANAGQIVRLMQRREGGKRLELGQQVAVHPGRPAPFRAAMHHPVPDRLQL